MRENCAGRYIMRRFYEVCGGIRWAFSFDNWFEILVQWHIIRRRSPLVLVHQGFSMQIDAESSDRNAVTDVLVNGMYDKAISLACKGRSGFTYMNLGAHIGAFDIRCATLAGAVTNGLSVEMNPSSHARLLLNLVRNGLSQVTALNAGVWSEKGCFLVSDDTRGTGQRCEPDNKASNGRPVPLLTWRELASVYGDSSPIDLIKVDIEGSEGRFFKDEPGHIAGRARWIVVETHDEVNHLSVKGFLGRLGFECIQDEPASGICRIILARNLKI